MEASRFGFDLPGAYKFDPTNEDLVAHYLLPRAAGIPNPPYAHAVIDANPCSCPPWELLRRHGHGGSDHAFFFGHTVPARTQGGGRRRAVPAVEGSGGRGGKWHGQKTAAGERSLVVARGGGGGAQFEIKFEKRVLSYYDKDAGRNTATGWLMDEYEITHPPLPLPGSVLSRIRMTARAKKKRRQQQKLAAAAADQQLVPGPKQPGPSN